MASTPSLCLLISLLTSRITVQGRAFENLNIKFEITKTQSVESECHRREDVVMKVDYFFFAETQYEDGCKYSDSSADYSSDTDEFREIARGCNNKTMCNFRYLDDDDSLLGCFIELFYLCERKGDVQGWGPHPIRSTLPPITTATMRATTTSKTTTTVTSTTNSSNIVDETDDDDKDNVGGMQNRIIYAVIGVSVFAFVAVIVIIVLCGLFLCGWSSNVERWNSTRRRRRQQQNQQRNQTLTAPLDEYAYIDENRMLSESKVSTSSPSSDQQGDSHFKRNPADANGVDDYAGVAANNSSSTAAYTMKSGGKKPSLALSPIQGPTGAGYMDPLTGSKGIGKNASPSYQNIQRLSPSGQAKSAILSPAHPTPEQAEYTEPIPKSHRTEYTLPIARSERNLPQPGKVAPSRPAPSHPKTAHGQSQQPPARRASLPRHSKLMEGDIDPQTWIQHEHAISGDHSISQPSLVRENTALQPETHVYSQLGSQKIVPVVGNVYSG